MVKEVQEKSSNSQRDNIWLVAIEDCPGAKRKSILKFSDNSQIIILKEIIKRKNLFVAQSFNSCFKKALVQKSLELEVEQCSLRLVSGQPHSRYLLKLKLEKRGFDKDTIQFALKRMQELGCLNDREFAENWIASRLRKRYQGRSLLLAGLLRKGIDRETAQEVLAQMYLEEDEARRLAILIKKLQAINNLSYKKLFKRLTGRGFPATLVYKVLKKEQIFSRSGEDLKSK